MRARSSVSARAAIAANTTARNRSCSAGRAIRTIYNPRFLAFSSHYEFRPLAVRRGHPNDKPRTERSFWEVERSFLNGREFRDIDDMRAQLAGWIDRTVDHRPLDK